MIEKGIIRESEAESDLFAELLDEKMIFDMIIDLTYDRQEYSSRASAKISLVGG